MCPARDGGRAGARGGDLMFFKKEFSTKHFFPLPGYYRYMPGKRGDKYEYADSRFLEYTSCTDHPERFRADGRGAEAAPAVPISGHIRDQTPLFAPDNLRRAEIGRFCNTRIQLRRCRSFRRIFSHPIVFDDLTERVIRVLFKERRTRFPAGTTADTPAPVDCHVHAVP
jgi:hypothetical protein